MSKEPPREPQNTALLLSIKPRFADAIFAGHKKYELRRVKPRLVDGDLVLVYVTSPRCALEGAFEVQTVHASHPRHLWKTVRKQCGISYPDFIAYFDGSTTAYAIEVKHVWLLNEQVPLGSLRSKKINPPQSYQYLHSSQVQLLCGE